MSHRVHAAVDRVQPAGAEHPLDLTIREAERHQLVPRHDPVMLSRKLREPLLPQPNATLWSSGDQNVALAVHDSIVAVRVLQRTRGL